MKQRDPVTDLSTTPTVVSPARECKLGITLHTVGGLAVWQPYRGNLSQLCDRQVRIDATTRWSHQARCWRRGHRFSGTGCKIKNISKL